MKSIEITMQSSQNGVVEKTYIMIDGKDNVVIVGVKQNRELSKIIRETQKKVIDLSNSN